MSRRFDYFVIFAGMRTGSNFLERNLNVAPDVQSYGELFNPYFIGHQGQERFLGLSLADREANPMELVDQIRRDTDGLAGFRLFRDHDPRVRQAAVADPRCAKLILTRNPLESYISHAQAKATKQWVMTDAKSRVSTPQVMFSEEAFRSFAGAQAAFLRDLRTQLAAHGQTALTLDYADLSDLAVINGALAYLGSEHRVDRPETSLKRQNPEDITARVSNPDEMRNAVASLDPFSIDPHAPARLNRGALVRSYMASHTHPVLYLPVHTPFSGAVSDWMTRLDGGVAPHTGMTQKILREWRTAQSGTRTFTVIAHPVRRLWDVFEQSILPADAPSYAEVRRGLINAYDVPLPDQWPDPELSRGQVRRAFVMFCRFVKANLAGQTSLRLDEGWVSQHSRLQGMAPIAQPDVLLRDGDMAVLTALGAVPEGAPQLVLPQASSLLADIYDAKIENLVRSVYARDYAVFGLGDWADC